jgi:hypothetical protein
MTRLAREKIEFELHQKLDSIIEAMTENVPDMGVTLFMPHVADGAYRKTSDAAKCLSIVARARKIIQIQPEMMEVLNYKLENPIDPTVMEEIYGQDILATLWSVDLLESVTKVLENFVRNISEPMSIDEKFDENGNRISSGAFQPPILETLIVYLDQGDNENNSQQNGSTIEIKSNKSQEIEIHSMERKDRKNSNYVTRSSKGSNSLNVVDVDDDDDDGDGRPKVRIPPVWTPSNQSGNSLFMFKFFRNVN